MRRRGCAFIRCAEFIKGRNAGARIAQPPDAPALAALPSHQSIGPRIFTMPNPINAETMGSLIDIHLAERARGEGILFASFNAIGEATAHFDVQVWPERSIAKFGGAVKAERRGWGGSGACGLAAV